MEQLDVPTLSALYEQNIKSAQDVVKLTQQQMVALGIDDHQRQLLCIIVFRLCLKHGILR